MKVYLAGGMRSGWHERVKAQCNHVLYDPSSKDEAKMTLEEYGTWDLTHIKNAAIVFVYIERSNPSGFGAAIEAGYAKGLGKTVILVLEPGHETHKDKYLAFFRKVADVTFDELDPAIKHLAGYA